MRPNSNIINPLIVIRKKTALSKFPTNETKMRWYDMYVRLFEFIISELINVK